MCPNLRTAYITYVIVHTKKKTTAYYANLHSNKLQTLLYRTNCAKTEDTLKCIRRARAWSANGGEWAEHCISPCRVGRWFLRVTCGHIISADYALLTFVWIYKEQRNYQKRTKTVIRMRWPPKDRTSTSQRQRQRVLLKLFAPNTQLPDATVPDPSEMCPVIRGCKRFCHTTWLTY